MSPFSKFLPFAALLMAVSCGPNDAVIDVGDDEATQADEKQRFSSAQATAMVFTFDGLLWAPGTVSSSFARTSIDEQLLYTIGHLNGNRSVGRLDKVVISGVRTAPDSGGTLISYKVVMPVSWGSKTNLPTSYPLVLPKRVGFSDLEAFTTKYSHTCIDTGAHDVDSGSMWYYYRPTATGCALADADVVKVTATAAVSTENTTGKYPEYQMVWADNALRVVAIFGKYEDGATTSSDSGISAYNQFVASMKTELAAYSLVTVPASVPTSPGVANPDVQLEGTLPGGKKVIVNALLVDNVSTAGSTFNTRYAALSTRADLISYNGHAGLGQNVRALSQKGKFVAGQYAIFFMNGCDTYAYVDGSLAQARAIVNPDDPTGTKYMEFVTNGMPAFFASMSGASMALVRALMKPATPLTYNQIFANIDSSQVVLVTGEEDNVFAPGGGGGGAGYNKVETASADKGQTLAFQTPSIPAGSTVTITLAHDPAHPGGDADLYVRVGAVPTTSSYDCRPYKSGSAEACTVTLGSSAAVVYVNVTGYATGANWFVLTIAASGGGVTPPPAWAGMNQSGTVAKNAEVRFSTPTLPAGVYTFNMTGTGDADLYVRVGVEPTTAAYDCRPYASGTAESCTMNIAVAAPVHVMVRGYAATSTFTLVGKLK